VEGLTPKKQGRNYGGKGAQCPSRPIIGRHRITEGAPKNHDNVTSTFFDTVHLLPEVLKFEHGSAKLAACPRRRRYSPAEKNAKFT